MNKDINQYWNQTYAIEKVNEKVKVDPVSFWKYEKQGMFGPDGILMHGTRKMPGYSDARIKEIIKIITEFKTLGKVSQENE